MTKHNKYYYDKGRNGWIPTTTWQDEVVEDKDNKRVCGEINPKMFITKEEIEFMVKNLPVIRCASAVLNDNHLRFCA